jgi:hypothetical protein
VPEIFFYYFVRPSVDADIFAGSGRFCMHRERVSMRSDVYWAGKPLTFTLTDLLLVFMFCAKQKTPAQRITVKILNLAMGVI